ncbi:MAG TPA: Hsp20/alpha crystallin family protein [Burkholderiaceae bacterium]|nr:Hsp20/alpha crystallin family protein [Burkholderiaceae bacterium]
MFVVPLSTTMHRRAFHRPPTAFATRPSACAGVPAEVDAARVPRLDVIERDAAYDVVLDMPGVAREQLDVVVEGRRLTVSTKAIAPATTDAAERVLHRERGSSGYARSVLLPEELDNAQSKARLENGVLTLTLAKRPVASASKIQVN